MAKSVDRFIKASLKDHKKWSCVRRRGEDGIMILTGTQFTISSYGSGGTVLFDGVAIPSSRWTRAKIRGFFRQRAALEKTDSLVAAQWAVANINAKGQG